MLGSGWSVEAQGLEGGLANLAVEDGVKIIEKVGEGYNLGGNGFTVLRKIIIPYAMPGIVAVCIVVFMLTAGSYLTPILLGGKNSSWFTEQIYDQFITRYNWESGAAFGFLLLAFTSLVVWLGLKLSGQSLSSTVAKS